MGSVCVGSPGVPQVPVGVSVGSPNPWGGVHRVSKPLGGVSEPPSPWGGPHGVPNSLGGSPGGPQGSGGGLCGVLKSRGGVSMGSPIPWGGSLWGPQVPMGVSMGSPSPWGGGVSEPPSPWRCRGPAVGCPALLQPPQTPQPALPSHWDPPPQIPRGRGEEPRGGLPPCTPKASKPGFGAAGG